MVVREVHLTGDVGDGGVSLMVSSKSRNAYKSGADNNHVPRRAKLLVVYGGR